MEGKLKGPNRSPRKTESRDGREEIVKSIKVDYFLELKEKVNSQV